MRIQLCICVIFLFSLSVKSQSLTPTIIASAGDEWEVNEIGTISWTLGETAISTYGNESQILTEGFHQPVINSTPVLEHKPLELTISVFPNPTSGALYINLNEYKKPIILTVIDLLGRVYTQHTIQTNNAWINLDDLPPGSYFIQSKIENELIGTFKIQKI